MVTRTQKMEGILRPGPAALFILILSGVGLSMAFPYGMGIVVFIWIVAIAGALCGAGLACFSLVKNMFARTATFGYSPTTAYMAGKKVKGKKGQSL